MSSSLVPPTIAKFSGIQSIKTESQFSFTNRLLYDNDLRLLPADGAVFEKISSPELEPAPIQITDIFHVPEKNRMMALWFAGDYQGKSNSWGILISEDDGISWKQCVVEDKLPVTQE